MPVTNRVQENRVRRVAQRRGLRLVKSRRRDPQAVDYGLYALIDVDTNSAVNPPIAQRFVCSWTLDEAEAYLNS
jgi:hypothetical protein